MVTELFLAQLKFVSKNSVALVDTVCRGRPMRAVRVASQKVVLYNLPTKTKFSRQTQNAGVQKTTREEFVKEERRGWL